VNLSSITKKIFLLEVAFKGNQHMESSTRCKDTPHGLKYSFVYIIDNEELLVMIIAEAREAKGISGARWHQMNN